MVVEGQRPDAVEDLVEEILRVDLLHDLPVDAVAHPQQPVAIDPVHRRRQRLGDARDQPPILAIEGVAGADQRHRAPRATAPS